MESSLADDIRTNMEIRRLIQAYLQARNRALPPRYRPAEPAFRDPESQETDDYGDFDIDLNDPALLQMLGESEPSPSVTLDKRVAKVFSPSLNYLRF